jgi:hypothetical protein
MSVPVTSGPTKAMKRGALKQKLNAVARMRVGNASGSHTGHHVYWPSEKDPFTAQATNYGRAAIFVSTIYLVGIVAAPFFPETRGRPLPARGGRGSTAVDASRKQRSG